MTSSTGSQSRINRTPSSTSPFRKYFSWPCTSAWVYPGRNQKLHSEPIGLRELGKLLFQPPLFWTWAVSQHKRELDIDFPLGKFWIFSKVETMIEVFIFCDSFLICPKYFFKDLFLSFFFLVFICMSMYGHGCMSTRDSRRGHPMPWSQSYKWLKWERNSSPLWEQNVLLNPEPTLQPLPPAF